MNIPKVPYPIYSPLEALPQIYYVCIAVCMALLNAILKKSLLCMQAVPYPKADHNAPAEVTHAETCTTRLCRNQQCSKSFLRKLRTLITYPTQGRSHAQECNSHERKDILLNKVPVLCVGRDLLHDCASFVSECSVYPCAVSSAHRAHPDSQRSGT